jgi:SpoVK/Ycf46/Vps4 family AAA+-type ATPase
LEVRSEVVSNEERYLGKTLPKSNKSAHNYAFIDLALTWLETLLDMRTFQRHGMNQPEGAESAEPSTILSQYVSRLQEIENQLTSMREDARQGDEPLPFDVLAQRYQLGPLEERILLLALGTRLDASLRKRIARFKDNILLDYCDVDLCLGVLFDGRVDRLAAMEHFRVDAPLVRTQLIKPVPAKEGSADALVGYELHVPERVISYLLGHEALEAKLAPFCWLSRPDVLLDTVVLPDVTFREMLHLAEQFGERSITRKTGGANALGPLDEAVLVQLSGESGTGKSHLAAALATHLGVYMLEVDCGKLATDEARFKSLLEEILWQARIVGAIVVFDQADAILGERNARLSTFFSEMDRWDGLAFLCTNDARKLDASVARAVVYQFDFEAPEMLDRLRLWQVHLPNGLKVGKDVDLEDIAMQYELTGGQIKNAVLVATNMALSNAGNLKTITQEHLMRSAHTQMRAKVTEFARRSKVSLTMDDLILPDDVKTEIDAILDAAKKRSFVMNKWGFAKKLVTGKGIVTMFCGEPGTGKTLCAEILANELSLELYQISIPQVMSKYIGETEKNIAKIFQSAKANHAMLLFDEADSLFASRVKVETSVDKFSNMETNLLLQEIERFEGIVILTTNLDKQIDKAFQRRIQFKVTFPFPEADMRTMIWEKHFPSECPVADDLDWELLGESFELSGGHIKNAVLRAAYRAACTDHIVSMENIRYAAEQECKHAGKLFRSFKLEHEFDEAGGMF